MTTDNVLEVESLLQSLSDEMLKLKSTSEHYEETKQNLEKMCESLKKIYQTHSDLTDNITQVLTEMEKTNTDNKKTRELIKSIYIEAKELFETETHRHEATIEASLSRKYEEINIEISKHTKTLLQDNSNHEESLTKKYNENRDDAQKQTDKILLENTNQHKILTQISEEIKKQTESVHQEIVNQTKSQRLTKYCLIAGLIMEAIIIIRLLLF